MFSYADAFLNACSSCLSDAGTFVEEAMDIWPSRAEPDHLKELFRQLQSPGPCLAFEIDDYERPCVDVTDGLPLTRMALPRRRRIGEDDGRWRSATCSSSGRCCESKPRSPGEDRSSHRREGGGATGTETTSRTLVSARRSDSVWAKELDSQQHVFQNDFEELVRQLSDDVERQQLLPATCLTEIRLSDNLRLEEEVHRTAQAARAKARAVERNVELARLRQRSLAAKGAAHPGCPNSVLQASKGSHPASQQDAIVEQAARELNIFAVSGSA